MTPKSAIKNKAMKANESKARIAQAARQIELDDAIKEWMDAGEAIGRKYNCTFNLHPQVQIIVQSIPNEANKT